MYTYIYIYMYKVYAQNPRLEPSISESISQNIYHITWTLAYTYSYTYIYICTCIEYSLRIRAAMRVAHPPSTPKPQKPLHVIPISSCLKKNRNR